MKRTLSILVAVVLSLTAIACADSLGKIELDAYKDSVDKRIADEFKKFAYYYLPMKGIDLIPIDIELDENGHVKKSVTKAEYRGKEMIFSIDERSTTLEFSTDEKELNLNFTKSLVFTLYPRFELLDGINKLPEFRLRYDLQETIYAYVDHGLTVQYSILDVDEYLYKHTIRVLW